MTISDDNKVKLILVLVGIGLGLVLGWITNVLWFAFSGIILGWGDSAPDWYFNIQTVVQTNITVAAILLTIVGLQWFFIKRKMRKRMVSISGSISETDYNKQISNSLKRFSPKDVLGAIFGLALGLFVGVLIIGTLIRVLFYILFGWADSAPIWGVCTEAVLIIGSTILSIYYSMRWSLGLKKNNVENV